ncbi:MAG: hypothetical protein ACRD1S_18550 [Vicinamibacterales bacterium]
MAGVCFVWVWPGAWLGWLVSAVFVAPPAVKLPAVPRLEAAALVADAGPVVRPFVRTALLRERNKVRAMLRQARREVEF